MRIVSGLVLLTFVTCHMTNLILGLRSLQAMEAARPWLMGPWRTGPGITLLVVAAITHILLGLYAIASRRSFAVSKTDVTQLALGLVTPPLLLNHAVVMHMAGEVSPGFDSTFGQMLAIYWSFTPRYAFQQVCVVMVVWMHASIGLYSWLVLKPVWRRIGGLVLPLLFAIPILALLGFTEAGKEALDRLVHDPQWNAHIRENIARVVKVTSQLDAFQARILSIYGALLAVAVAIFGRRILAHRNEKISVGYDGGTAARGRRGLSILEISLLNDVPHAHVCSGRGRCGTCRIRVEAGAAQLSPVEDLEHHTLERVGAAAGERLACQARALGDGVVVTRLLPAFADASAARSPQDWSTEAAAPAPGGAP